MKSDLGKFQLETPRDRNGTFEPQTVPKRQDVIASDVEKNNHFSLYAKNVFMYP